MGADAMTATVRAHAAQPADGRAEHVLPPDVILLKVADGSARLLDMAGSFHAVSEVGARMLQETLAHGVDTAATRIAADYGVDRQRVRDDIAVFLRALEKQRLICSRRNVRRGGKPGPARLVLLPLLRAAHRCKGTAARARMLLIIARLSFGLLGWTRAIAIWKEAHAHLPARQPAASDTEVIEALDKAVGSAAASYPVVVECKERALCAWSLARAAGLEAALVVGVEVYPMAGHCWCEVGTRVVGDSRERAVWFAPVGRW
jgi:hypothetical protein